MFPNVYKVSVLKGVFAKNERGPSKQKLELKSSKTRLLPSRSGVLIEFKSGVLIGYSRAIQGLKLDFSPR